MSSDKKQFESGFQPEVQHHDVPGKQKDMDPSPSIEYVPTPEGGYKLYQAAGKLKDRKALITGGDSGIGRATAVLFAMEGADSFITYLPEEKEDAEETKKLVEKYGRKCFTYEANLKGQDACKKVAEQALKQLGHVNILFNNHAYQMVKNDITELSEDQWLHTFDTNIHPFFFLSKYLIPHMKRGDTIINNASINAYIGRPDLLDYTSTKGAIVSFTRGLSNQFVSKGIRVNAVAPGPVWTPLIPATMGEEQQKQFTSPMGRPGQPSEIATCLVFLASTDSSQLSGQTIHANGGVIVNG
ncbi:putative oxidoreductase C4H3.08 [Pseudocercospora fuligena]|uniref:Putative oxidoreductase C4H3.08 n=1 Tax=Pseudocercospora fuligena TaxID=685502 RepID=A0A8H6RBK3_9PEZI|nr:putative oxidoreductase C4H3.08 [Pseudocercospora fuligena]